MPQPIAQTHTSPDETRAPVTRDAPARTLRTPDELLAAGLIAAEVQPAIEQVAREYATAVPPAFLALIERPDDPIGLQVIPHPDESVMAPGESVDPIGDDALSPVPGVVHRYEDRALLKPLLICPLYCRFCFRREHVGPDGGLLDESQLEAAFAWLEEHPAIREVILTGGDPLMLSPRRLSHIIQRLSRIDHVTTIRIHTRVPLAAPERMTAAMLDAMETDRALWLVLHANHAREFSPAGTAALRDIRKRGIPLLAQSVLLRGVNDSVAALEALFRAMVERQIKPYYLHQLDHAPGTARFHVPIAEGRALLEGLRGRVTGLAWPTYVLDIPGGYGKVPLGPDYIDLDNGLVSDPGGQPHRFVPK